MTARPISAESVALEHLAWARQHGFTFAQVLRSIGAGGPPTIDNVVTQLARTWIELPAHGRKRRAA